MANRVASRSAGRHRPPALNSTFLLCRPALRVSHRDSGPTHRLAPTAAVHPLTPRGKRHRRRQQTEELLKTCGARCERWMADADFLLGQCSGDTVPAESGFESPLRPSRGGTHKPQSRNTSPQTPSLTPHLRALLRLCWLFSRLAKAFR